MALETPEANLVDGMHWLLGTFSVRFNRFRKERGRVSDWEIKIASQLREIGVSFGWISERLDLGNVDALRARIYRHRKGQSSQPSP